MSTEKAKCSRCHQLKPVGELNGVDPITGDDSHAYCRKIAECDSNKARQVLDELSVKTESCAECGVEFDHHYRCVQGDDVCLDCYNKNMTPPAGFVEAVGMAYDCGHENTSNEWGKIVCVDCGMPLGYA